MNMNGKGKAWLTTQASSTIFSGILALLLPTGVAIWLLVLSLRDWYGDPDLAAWVKLNRSTIAIAVQVVSSVFGLLAVKVIGSCFKLWPK